MATRKKKETALAPTTQADDARPALAKQFHDDAAASLEALRELPVTTHDEELVAVQLAAAVKEKAGEVVEMRKHLLEPHELGVKRVNGIWMPIEKLLGEAERVIKAKIEERHLAAAREGDRLLKEAGAASAAGDTAAAEALLAQRTELEPQKIEGRTASTTWDGEVVDPSAIPREFLIPDVAALRARTKSLGGDPGIAGWRAFPKVSTSITVSKVQR